MTAGELKLRTSHFYFPYVQNLHFSIVYTPQKRPLLETVDD
jgi:hypothetical protein